MDVTKEILQLRYAKFSDAALLAAKAAGAGPYSPLAWEVIQDLIVARGLTERATTPPAQPQAPPVSPPASVEAVEAAVRPAVSPYLLVSLLRKQRWPVDAELPMTARHVIGLAALIFGIAGSVLVILAVVNRGLAAAFNPDVLKLAAVSAVSIGFAASSRRPPSPWHWWFAMLYSGALPPLALSQMATSSTAPGPLIALEVVVGLLWLLYFARRRTAYGLRPGVKLRWWRGRGAT